MKALVVAQCFPPLLKNAGGVSKRYLTLCRALIDGLGWQVTLMTPVDVSRSREPDVERWLACGSLVHVPARGVRIRSKTDGVAVFLDLFSFVNAGFLLRELCFYRGYDCVFTDDVPWRLELLLLTRAVAVPTVVSSHTDITHMKSYKGVVKLVWKVHMLSTRLAAVHATVSRVFGAQMARTYGIPVDAVWPPILWSPEFRSDPSEWAELAKQQRGHWLELLAAQGCAQPRAILLSAGRWSAEKRIHLLVEALPSDCALVIVGDGTSGYCTSLENAGPPSGRPNVLPLRKMLSGRELRVAYAAADLFLSASNFETLGNTIIEAWCSGTPVAVQPAQGHLEFVKDGVNSWFVDYDDTTEARAALERISVGGLDAVALVRRLPELASTGERLRTADFARDFEAAVIQPALTAGRKRYSLAGLGCLLEVAKRCIAFALCTAFFFTIRTFTRLAFVFSKEPEMEVLGKLGSAVDDKPGKVVSTFPCLRLLRGQVWRRERACSVDSSASSSSAMPTKRKAPDGTAPDGTDYESHYVTARRTKSAVLNEFQAGFGGASG
eukprot:TRINITY_DN62899_c0_g1_i1.p1 TRINITY_DN62899_c0_g1~~TRINITY_DN62899_c0_g1_i1.p1  ORF type:complete len:552 (-),score=118.49 TRINITY_DN62899_c0_g1_i1:92-1747(-)